MFKFSTLRLSYALLLLATLAFPIFSHAETEPTVATAEEKSPWEAIFPSGLVKAGKKSSTASTKDLKALDGKFVGIYSSASWCGPCKMFTPELVKFYKKHKKQLEIVFFSSDKTEADSIRYMKKAKMKWFMYPQGKRPNFRPTKGGIPNLVVFSPDGKVCDEISGFSREKPDPRLEKLAEKMEQWFSDNAAKE